MIEPLIQIPPPQLLPDGDSFTALFRQPYLTTSRGILIRDDCLNVLRHLRDESVHCVFADPPFNLGKDYDNGHSDAMEHPQYITWCQEWLTECIRVLVPGGALFIYNIPKGLIYLGAFLNHSLTFRHWIAVSMKNTYPRGNSLYPAHYGLLYYTKGKPRIFNKLRTPIPVCRHCGKEIKDYGGHRDKLKEEGLNLTDFWDDTSPVRHKKFKTRVANELKPIIPERSILMATNARDIVLDPFGGGGSTYQMAEKHDRYWIGCEIAPCEPIVERLQANPHTQLGQMCPASLMAIFKTD